MHKITLITVGKIKTLWIKDGCDVFVDRLKHSFDFTERILAAGSQEEEEERLEEVLIKIGGTIFILDAEGKQHSSEDFSRLIGKERDAGRPMTFVIGGAYGLSPDFKKGRTLLSLGKMTFPHEISKLLLLEQLFRAEAIRQGTGYHH